MYIRRLYTEIVIFNTNSCLKSVYFQIYKVFQISGGADQCSLRHQVTFISAARPQNVLSK